MAREAIRAGEPRFVEDPYAVNSLWVRPGDDPVSGRTEWDPARSWWNGAMALVTLVFAPLTFSPSALAVFALTSGAVLMLGHSVGFHRRLIHRSFKCPKGLEYILAWFGTAVGMSGPLWMIRTHDLRDWGQRQPDCHPALRHAAPLHVDYWWNLHSRLVLAHPPRFDPGPGIGDDRLYRFSIAPGCCIRRPIALALYALGGWDWVVGGVGVRVFACVTGHWFVGRLSHRQGPQTWLVDGAGVQATTTRPGRRFPHHGRGLAQQSPRLPWLGAHGPLSGPGRLGIPLHSAARGDGSGVGRAHARHPAAPRLPTAGVHRNGTADRGRGSGMKTARHRYVASAGRVVLAWLAGGVSGGLLTWIAVCVTFVAADAGRGLNWFPTSPPWRLSASSPRRSP